MDEAIRELKMGDIAEEDFIGINISQAREKLGYWWILQSQNTSSEESDYTFYRAGKGTLILYTKNNIVYKIEKLLPFIDYFFID